MGIVEVSYQGDRHCVALDTRSGKRIGADCSMTKGQEFGPESLVAAGLGSCMLISMASFAERHGLDVAGARIDVEPSFGGKPQMRISGFEITVRIPRGFAEEDEARLKAAADACPIKHSFGPETEITTEFRFADASVAAA